MQIDIRNLEMEEIAAFVEKQGEKSFRARQIYEWLWKKNALSFDDMSNLSLNLRESLKKNYIINRLSISTELISKDKTRKYGFLTSEGQLVEGVLIPSGKRITACISSQIGCPLNCSFCATLRQNSQRAPSPSCQYHCDDIFHTLSSSVIMFFVTV